jgi:hypothetical protein
MYNVNQVYYFVIVFMYNVNKVYYFVIVLMHKVNKHEYNVNKNILLCYNFYIQSKQTYIQCK